MPILYKHQVSANQIVEKLKASPFIERELSGDKEKYVINYKFCNPELWKKDVEYFQSKGLTIDEIEEKLSKRELYFSEDGNWVSWYSHGNINTTPAHYLSSVFPMDRLYVRIAQKNNGEFYKTKAEYYLQGDVVVSKMGIPVKKCLTGIRTFNITPVENKNQDGTVSMVYKTGIYLGAEKNGKSLKSFLYLPAECLQFVNNPSVNTPEQIMEFLSNKNNTVNVVFTTDEYLVYNTPPAGGKGNLNVSDIYSAYNQNKMAYRASQGYQNNNDEHTR